MNPNETSYVASLGRLATPGPLKPLRFVASSGYLATPLLLRGMVAGYLSLIVLLPLTAIIWRSSTGGYRGFVEAATMPEAIASLKLTLLASGIVTGVNACVGTLIAWVLVRDSFPGKGAVNAVIDLPFALPTIVAGLTLLTLYGPHSPVGVNVAYTRIAVVLALLFVTLPFVVRSVQPVLVSMDLDAEEAAYSLGASGWQTFTRVLLPILIPSILSGCALGFSRAVGEFGSVVLISGNIPFKTEVASVSIFGLIENNDISSAAAISTVLLAASSIILMALQAAHFTLRRHRG